MVVSIAAANCCDRLLAYHQSELLLLKANQTLLRLADVVSGGSKNRKTADSPCLFAAGLVVFTQ